MTYLVDHTLFARVALLRSSQKTDVEGHVYSARPPVSKKYIVVVNEQKTTNGKEQLPIVRCGEEK